MKKLLALAALVACATAAQAALVAQPIAPVADDGSATFAIAPAVGVLDLKIRSHVFIPASETETGKRHQMSRLDWEPDPSAVLGIAGSLRLSRFSLNAAVASILSSGDSGTLDDYDWTLEENQAEPNDRSHHDVELTKALVADLNLSFDLLQSFHGLDAWLALGAHAESYSAKGRNGWYDYNEDINDDDPDAPPEIVHETGTFSGTVVRYDQDVLFAYLAAGARWSITDRIALSAYAAYAPGYHFSDRDNHDDRDITFKSRNDYDGEAILLGAAVTGRISERLSLTFSYEFQRNNLSIGDSLGHWEDGEWVETAHDSAGVDLKSSLFLLSCAYSF